MSISNSPYKLPLFVFTPGLSFFSIFALPKSTLPDLYFFPPFFSFQFPLQNRFSHQDIFSLKLSKNSPKPSIFGNSPPLPSLLCFSFFSAYLQTSTNLTFLSKTSHYSLFPQHPPAEKLPLSNFSFFPATTTCSTVLPISCSPKKSSSQPPPWQDGDVLGHASHTALSPEKVGPPLLQDAASSHGGEKKKTFGHKRDL